MTTYTQLQANLQNWMENPSDEYVAALPTIISMAEAKIYRDLSTSAMVISVTDNLVTGVPSFSRPSDLIQPKHFKIRLASGRWKILQLKSQEYLIEYAPDDTDTGEPVYYAVENNTIYRVAPAPDADYEYEFEYVRYLTPLSASNEENWLSTVGYDCLFAACVIESAKFVLDDRQASILGMWQPAYDTAIMSLNAVDRRSERDDFRVPNRTIRNE